MDKIAFISGASSGIGMATARIFAQNGINIIICGRRIERLQSLAEELKEKVKVYVLSFDVRHKLAVFEAIESLPPAWKNIDILVNNAGNAHGLDLAQDASLDDWDMMIDINVKGLMYVTKAFLPGMVKRKSGHIINISSIAGKEVYTKGNAYCASKHAVTAFSDGLRLDLSGTNVKVSAINPGAVDTEFSEVRFKGDKIAADKVYDGFTPLYAIDIAEIIYFVVSRPPHVNLSDTIVLPAAQASASVIHRKTN